jgi:hypothetical protein
MANGRCRLHGGLSTGPKTAEGIARISRARWKHGRYTKAALEAARLGRASTREWSRQWLAALRDDAELRHTVLEAAAARAQWHADGAHVALIV